MEYGLVGRTLGHSFSPLLHRLLWGADYGLMPMAEEELEPFFRARSFRGVNVTVPYKKTVMPFLDEIDNRALRIGCVNTVIRQEDGRLVGYNTDYDGFGLLADRTGISFSGRNVLIFGSGATAGTAACVAEDRGCRKVTYVSRTGKVNYQNLDTQRDAEILINATPVGMFPDNGSAPADPALFPACRGVLDVVYNPLKSRLVQRAASLGLPASGGLPMLAGQAAAAMPLFGAGTCSPALLEQVLTRLERMQQNIVLIGMPGSGKSTVGRMLAKALDRPLIDTDQMVTEQAGKSIPCIFGEDGEASFRRMEAEMIRKAAVRTGCVISIGGGGVLLPENREALTWNGRIYYLDRDAGLLCRRGRPLSDSGAALDRMVKKRTPIYEELCDRRVENNGTIQTAVQDILSDFM